MLRAVFSAVALLVVLGGRAVAGSCDLQRVANLDVTPAADGLLAIPVTVSGEPVEMLLDTGAERGVIDISVTQKLGLTPLKIYARPPQFNVPGAPLLSIVQFTAPDFYLSDGTKLDHFVKVPTVDMGAAHFGTVEFLLAKFDDAAIQGIAGSNMLRNFDVEVDPRGAKVNLFSPQHCPDKVVYWASAYSDLPARIGSNGQIEIEMSLDGHDITATIDTGAPHTSLNLAAARRIFDIDTDSPSLERVSGAGGDTVYRLRFRSLTAGPGLEVRNPQIYLTPDKLAEREMARARASYFAGPTGYRAASLVLGMNVLSQLHFYIAYREQKVYFTAASAGETAH
ncbi:MAG: aspartyl protease family protein [Rhizomicrobium sp.]